MGSDLYFFEQCETHKVARRYRKLPEDLPESLRFAHLNPKVAALLASKERGQKVDSEDPFGDGMGKKSLLPDINAAFQNVRNQFDSALSNDEDSQRYLFEEAKLSATTILHQLSQIIYFYEDLHKFVPKSLEYHLMSGFTDFTSDVVVVPREWQTQEMKEQYMAKQQQELNTANSEEELSDNELNILTGRSKSRLGTERSGSEAKTSVKKSKPKLGAIDDDTESILPKSESRQGKRSDSRVSIGSQFRHPADLGNLSRLGNRRKGGSIYGPSPSLVRNRTRDDFFGQYTDTPSEARSTALANPMSYMQTINFQLSNTVFEDKGWIMLKGRQEEIDQNQILEYCVQRLQESLKSVTAQATKEVDQGYDKPVVIRYYGDAKKETLLKYRKSPNKISASPLNKAYKPKVPSIIDERNEGKKLMQAQHIDGSTVVYYPSGRPAIIYSAAGFGRPGYYTLVYEDDIDSRMLACFTPSGRGVCYYDNGTVRFLATEKGGHLSELNGKLNRKWKWPQANVKITEPISFQMNGHLIFRCVGQTQISIVFNCQRETARFSVGLVPEADEYKPIEESDQLLTAFTFSSKAAKDLMRIFAPAKKNKKKSRKNKDKTGKEVDVDYDVKKQVSFVERPGGIKEGTQGSSSRRMSLSPDGPRFAKGYSVSPSISSLKDEERSASADSAKNDRRGTVSPCAGNKQLRKGSASPNMGRVRTPSPTKEQTKSSVLYNNVLNSLNEIAETRSIASASNAQLDQSNPKRLSITPEPANAKTIKIKVKRTQSAETKKKRTQSAYKSNPKYDCLMKGKPIKTLEDTEPVKEIPKISEESNLYVQNDAYTEKWEYRRIEVEAARKAEKELKMNQRAQGNRRKSIMKKGSGLDKTNSKTSCNETGQKASGKSHSARRKSVIDQDSIMKRAQSAEPFYEQADRRTKDKAAKTENDQTAGVENQSSTEPSSSGFERRRSRRLSSVFGSLKENTVINDNDENKDTEKEPDRESPSSPKPMCLGFARRPRAMSVFGSIKEDAELDETDASKSIEKETEKDEKETEKDEKETEKDEKEKSKSEVKQLNVPTIIVEDPEGEKECVLEASTYTNKTCSENSDSEKGRPTLTNNDKQKTESAEECTDGGRRQSAIMDTIMAFRRNIFRKKSGGISESEESSDDSSDTHTSKSQSSEILKLLQDFPDKVHYELEADKELARLQRKARNLVDDWMEHYRLALGLATTSLQNFRDKPSYSVASRNIKSARVSDHQLQIRRAVLGVEDPEPLSKKNRIPSAPLAGLGNEFMDEDFHAELTVKQDNTGVTFEDKGQSGGDGTISPSATALINKLTETASRRSARSRATSARSSSPARQPTIVSASERVPSANQPVTRSHCPIVIRQQLLGHERPQCRCSRHHIPFIMDLELDDFLSTETPEGQLTVIMVVSSLFPGITKAEEMLNEIYTNQNRNRTRPCVQSRSDMFRVFKYDVNSAAEMSDHTQPLLMMRHNVVPGMLLIYCDGNLYFCDHIFNGYGNTRKDFKKQLMKSRHDAIHGNALPKDFRFSPSQGKSGMRSAWGGEIGGAGVDKYSSPGTVVDNTLQPIHRPNSDSSNGDLPTNLHLDAVKLKAAQYLSMSLSATGFQPATLTPQPIATNL